MRPHTLLICAPLLLTACPKSAPAPAAATGADVGWHSVGDIQCYTPPDIAAEPNELRRKRLRQATWSDLQAGLSGEKDTGVAMAEGPFMALEIMVLSNPERIEAFSQEALEMCTTAGQSGNTEPYQQWLAEAASSLAAAGCHRPLVYEVHDYIKVSAGWHLRYHMCRGDKIRLEVGAGSELYTVYDTGMESNNVYHGILGDETNPVTPSAPCQSCRAGELLLRFEEDEGGSAIQPLAPVADGADLAAIYAQHADSKFKIEFTAPADGHISFSVNDDTAYDNVYYDNPAGHKEYVSLDLYPVIGEGEMYNP